MDNDWFRFASRSYLQKLKNGADLWGLLGLTATGYRSLIVFALAFGALIASDAALFANKAAERRIAFYNIHTKDTVDVVYKRRGRRIPEAMKQINWVLRDWRQDKATKMDPKLIDILWEMHSELGSRQPIHVISGYRSKKTNAMLRKTRGGQATKSRHILGMAADVHFPDVPIKRLRYSAMIRERGGVGYYPTSAIPFVHVDTGRVRHWPRMPRQELALLFPSGKTRHRPPDNKPITIADVRKARVKNRALATEVASFHSFRRSPRAPRPTLVAENSVPTPNPAAVSAPWGAPQVTRADRVAQQTPPPPVAREPADRSNGRITVAALDPQIPASQPELRAAPRLVSAPIDTPSTFRPSAEAAEQSRLTDLFTLASLFPMGSWFGGDTPAPKSARVAQRDGAVPRSGSGSVVAGAVGGRVPPRVVDEVQQTFVSAPAFDEEHPDELFYRPFALGPLLTASASPDDPVLTTMVAPDPRETLAMLDEDLSALPMRFAPSREVAAVMWNDHFTGEAVNFGFASRTPQSDVGSQAGPELASRPVQTTRRGGPL
ncbi:MAG: DUF882 domain-containing protein [Pseudomonadota bacterium]